MTHSCPTRRSSDLIPGAALHRGVVGPDHHLAAADDADPGQLARPGHLAPISAACRQGRKLEERRAGVEQGRKPLAKPHLPLPRKPLRSEEHTSELQSLMRNSYAVFCLKTTNTQ